MIRQMKEYLCETKNYFYYIGASEDIKEINPDFIFVNSYSTYDKEDIKILQVKEKK